MQKIPAPSRLHAARNGSSESRPRYGFTVSASASGRALAVRLEVGGGIGARGRADVGALAVGEHDQPRRARVGADVFECADPVCAERLEERELRLDPDDVRRDRIDDPAAEALARFGGRRRERCASPASSTGSRSGRGSRPTSSWDRLRSTASASRSGKRAVEARAGSALTRERLAARSARNNDRGPLARPSVQNLDRLGARSLLRRHRRCRRPCRRHRRRLSRPA